jgi:hypothetical protein
MEKETFSRKGMTRLQVTRHVTEQLKIIIDPLMAELGTMLKSMHERIADLEAVSNTMILKVKELDEKNRTIN